VRPAEIKSCAAVYGHSVGYYFSGFESVALGFEALGVGRVGVKSQAALNR
jgi:hypothetical protein